MLFSLNIGPLKLSELEKDWDFMKASTFEPVYRRSLNNVHDKYAQ